MLGKVPPSGRPPRGDDWIVEVWFRGRKTGRTIYRRHGVSGHETEANAILIVWHSLYLDDPERVIDTRARRRKECETRSVALSRHKQWEEHAKRFVRC